MTTLAYVILGIIRRRVAVVLVLLFRAAWRVAEPDEALIISGFRSSQRPDGVGESMGFRIVTGRGRLVAPGITKVRRLSLEAHESEIGVPCVRQQKIRVDLRGVDRLQGRRRLPLDRQRRAAFPRPAGGGAGDQGAERVRRSPPRHRRAR